MNLTNNTIIINKTISLGLFHRAIAQSGSAFPVWANHNPPEYGEAIALAFLVKTSCFRKDSHKILKCLQRIPHEELYSLELEFYVSTYCSSFLYFLD